MPPDAEITVRPSLPHQTNRLHEVVIDGVHLVAKEYLRDDRGDGARYEYLALRLVEALDVAPRPVFFDPAVGPVVVYAFPDGRLGLVDWEDSGLRDPAREVADLLLHPNQEDLLDAHGWKAFLTPYPASRRSHPGFQDRLRGYLAIFPVFWLDLLLGEGPDRVARGALEGWLVNELAPNERLRRYLARCLAWPEPDPAGSLAALEDLVFF